MASYLSRLNPVPTFPDYTGPYKVGTVDVEIPILELDSPSQRPDPATDIDTIQFRIFYPAEAASTGHRISWLPKPQRQHVSGYTKFMGAGPVLAEVLSFLPRHLHYTSIPAIKNADLETPNTPNDRWPTVLFSHGLGGSRNAYSHLAGSLASHGTVVVCPDHRDGSAVTSFVRIPDAQDRLWKRSSRREITYRKLSHDATPEVFEAREGQLRIRIWELGLIHDALVAIDTGRVLKNLNKTTPSLEPFAGKLHIHEPGSLIFAGHSFGATTIMQLLKSTYYAGTPELARMENPLFVPAENSSIRRQVTEKSVTMLLDMWCMPLLAPNSAPLFNLPLPMYADVPTAAGGTALLAVESDSFYVWREHLHTTARVLSPDPSVGTVTPALFERPSGLRLSEPNFFYVVDSAHLSQSDFGILFPWLTKLVFNAVEPERVLRLNLRAQLQLLRANNVPIARTWHGDLVEGAYVDKQDMHLSPDDRALEDGIHDDSAIFERSRNGCVQTWKWIDTVGLGRGGGPLPSGSQEMPSQMARVDSEDVVQATLDSNKRVMEREAEGMVDSSLELAPAVI